MAQNPDDLSLAEQAEIADETLGKAIGRVLTFLVDAEVPFARSQAMALLMIGARALRDLGGTREQAHSSVDEGFDGDQEFRALYAARPN